MHTCSPGLPLAGLCALLVWNILCVLMDIEFHVLCMKYEIDTLKVHNRRLNLVIGSFLPIWFYFCQLYLFCYPEVEACKTRFLRTHSFFQSYCNEILKVPSESRFEPLSEGISQ
jgi:hypothetical protein